jgi:DNA adenine methylase
MSYNSATPLRYPGGKSLFTDYFKRYISDNFEGKAIYAEPYCGGAGLAMNLLIDGLVSHVLINDANYLIYAFWKSLIEKGEEFLQLFDNTEVNLDEWRKQRNIIKNIENTNDVLLCGFATFFLNRCNRSGILTAGPIGGQNEINQERANYKINARFNKITLKDKLKKIISLKDKITVTNLDAIDFLNNHIRSLTPEEQSKIFVYLDPPYYNQGSSIYLNYYSNEDHQILAEYLMNDVNLNGFYHTIMSVQ